jgi:hypothetical protein
MAFQWLEPEARAGRRPRSQWRVRAGLAPASLGHRPYERRHRTPRRERPARFAHRRSGAQLGGRCVSPTGAGRHERGDREVRALRRLLVREAARLQGRRSGISRLSKPAFTAARTGSLRGGTSGAVLAIGPARSNSDASSAAASASSASATERTPHDGGGDLLPGAPDRLRTEPLP